MDPGAAQVDHATVDSALREAITDQDVDAVRRLLATPGYRFPTTRSVFCLAATQSVGHVDQIPSARADPPSVCRRRGRDMLLALVAACDEDALCRRTLHRAYVDLDRDEAVTKVKKELIFPGITALHHFAWNGDVEAVQTILDLPQCTERVLNTELDAPPLSPPRRRALPQMPRVLLVPGPVETGTQRDGLRQSPSKR